METGVREIIPIPSGVSVEIRDGVVTVQGKNATLERRLSHPSVAIEKTSEGVLVSSSDRRRRSRALVGTFAAHIRNMIQGAQKNFEYRLKVVYAHFPIKVRVQGDLVLIENFLGEKHPRKARIVGKTQVKPTQDTLVVQGPDIEAVSQTASNIEQACRIRDRDPRVFQDGIYITVKGA